MIFIRFPFQCDLKVLDYETNPVNVTLIKHDIESYLGTDQFTLLVSGKPIHDGADIANGSNIQVVFSLPGGKGGFGSMLRAIGAQIEKTTNREACRDLSGRRLRDINEEQRLKKWIAKEAEREAEKIRRRKERIERLKSKAPHKFFDFDYEKEISELPSRINDALNEGLQKAKEPTKRPLELPPKKTWLADDFPASSDSDSDETDSATDGSPSKKPKLDQSVSSGCDADISESSQSLPGSSKYSTFIYDESSTSCDSKTVVTEEKSEENSVMSVDTHGIDEKSNNTDIKLVKQYEDTSSSSFADSKISDSADSSMDVCIKDGNSIPAVQISQSFENKVEKDLKDVVETEKCAENSENFSGQKSDGSTCKEGVNEEIEAPIDLLCFQSVSELEALGLDKLKSALMARGLKCGGTLSDRADRLWKVRGLQPHQYPAKFLAKNKK